MQIIECWMVSKTYKKGNEQITEGYIADTYLEGINMLHSLGKGYTMKKVNKVIPL